MDDLFDGQGWGGTGRDQVELTQKCFLNISVPFSI